MYHKGKTDEFGRNGASSGPGFYWFMGAGPNLVVYLCKQLFINKGALFKRSTH